MLVSLSCFFVSSYSLFQNARKHQSPILIGTSWHPNLVILLLAHLISLADHLVCLVQTSIFRWNSHQFSGSLPIFGWNHEHYMAILCWEKGFRESNRGSARKPARTNGGGLIELSAEELLAEDEEAMGRWGFGGKFDGQIPIIYSYSHQ